MKITYVPRLVWGASRSTEEWISKRYSASPEEKTEIQMHHTAAVDAYDDTPNRWTYARAVAYMKRLEWIRFTDLGPLPYSENIAVSEDLETVWIFQGRGILKVGAHTGGHNRAGVGFGVLGNFKSDPQAAQAVVVAAEWRVGRLRQGLTPNLGNVKNPSGWNAWGHRDSKATSCPGSGIYPLLVDFDLKGGLMSFSAHEIKQLKMLVASLDSVNSNGGFAAPAVKLIRRERSLPLHKSVAAGCDDCIKRGESIVVT